LNIQKKIFFYSFFAALFFFALSFASERSRDDLFVKMGIELIKGHTKAPNFCLEDLEGKKLELKHFKGKLVFLNFWATWCGPCKEEMPTMERLYQKSKEKDFVFLAISVDYEGKQSVKEFIKNKHYTFPVLLDPKCKVLGLYKVKGIPTTVFIDRDGRIVGKTTGPRDWNSPEAVSLLDSLLEK
jgi:peroxiredoxin